MCFSKLYHQAEVHYDQCSNKLIFQMTDEELRACARRRSRSRSNLQTLSLSRSPDILDRTLFYHERPSMDAFISVHEANMLTLPQEQSSPKGLFST